ncbi:MAG: TetR/AcrR family transcriptional regulator [Dermatophilaceae bacterium]
MPRIEAPTVAEHNAMRRRQVAEAAVDVLMEKGVAGLHPAAVAARTGLARSTMYQYYPSTEALLRAAVEAMLGTARERVEAALAPVPTPAGRVGAYVRAALDDARSGHGRLAQVSLMEMPEVCRDEIRALHDRVSEPLREALESAGVPDARMVAGFVDGVVNATARAIAQGAPAEPTVEAAVRFALAGAGFTSGQAPRPRAEVLSSVE